MEARPGLCITHSPGKMLVIDLIDRPLASLRMREPLEKTAVGHVGFLIRGMKLVPWFVF